MTLEAYKAKYTEAVQQTEQQIANLQVQAQRLYGAIAAVDEQIKERDAATLPPVNPPRKKK